MKLYSIFIMLNVFTSCKGNKDLHNYTVTEYQKVSVGYQYSKELLKHQGNTYRPVVSSDYLNDTLAMVAVYKSEGKITYSKAELQRDPLFKKTLELPDTRKLELSGNILTDNGKSHHVAELKGDSIFYINQDKLFLYTNTQ